MNSFSVCAPLLTALVIDVSLKLSVMCSKFPVRLVYGARAGEEEEQETCGGQQGNKGTGLK